MAIKNYYPYVIVFLYFITQVCSEGSVSVTVPWNGASGCGADKCTQELYAPHYACSDGRGDWNGGIGVFFDPIPTDAGNVIHNVSAMLVGWFGCNASVEVDAYVSINGATLGKSSVPTNAKCDCPNCCVTSTVNSDYYANGIQFYTYGQNVSVGFFTADPGVMCLSAIMLTFSYGPTRYTVRRIHPTTGPREGGTSVTIIGEHFDELTSPLCSFGGVVVKGNPINDTAINCTAPELPTECASLPCDVVLEVAELYEGYSNDKVKFTYSDGTPKTGNKEKRTLLLGVLGVGVAFSVVLISVGILILYQKRKAKKATAESAGLIVNEY